MTESKGMNSLFPVFLISVLGLVTTPWTLYRVSKALGRKGEKNIRCRCSECTQVAKKRTSTAKQVSAFLSFGNVCLVGSWLLIFGLFYLIKLGAEENQPFDPFRILGLESSASAADVKKAYRKLSMLYHPDKNPDPKANKYFVEYVSKSYQALTVEASRKNFVKWGHPDGRQGMQLGIALPSFLLDVRGDSGGILLTAIVGLGILVPLLAVVGYLSRSARYTGNNVMRETVLSFYHGLKPSFPPSKVVDVLIRASEFMDIPVRRSDDLQGLFVVVRSELNLDEQEEEFFWKNDPTVVKTEQLLLAHLMRKYDSVPPALKNDFVLVMDRVPQLLEELMKMAVIPRNAEGQGWLQPALGVMEVSQNIIQAVPLSARKASGVSSDGGASFFQLPHFDETIVKKLGRKQVKNLQDLLDLGRDNRLEVLTEVGLSEVATSDVQAVLEIMPSITVDVTCETEGEEGIQEGDIVTLRSWVTVRREIGSSVVQPHTPYFPCDKNEVYWLLLADEELNTVWASQRISFKDERAAIATASKLVGESLEGSGADESEVSKSVKEAREKVKEGSRLALRNFQAPGEGIYNLTAYCLCDSWIGIDRKVNVQLTVGKPGRAAVPSPDGGPQDLEDDIGEVIDEEDDEDYDEDDESEYSESDDEREDKE